MLVHVGCSRTEQMTKSAVLQRLEDGESDVEHRVSEAVALLPFAVWESDVDLEPKDDACAGVVRCPSRMTWAACVSICCVAVQSDTLAYGLR
jgi:hypothetical protein